MPTLTVEQAQELEDSYQQERMTPEQRAVWERHREQYVATPPPVTEATPAEPPAPEPSALPAEYQDVPVEREQVSSDPRQTSTWYQDLKRRAGYGVNPMTGAPVTISAEDAPPGRERDEDAAFRAFQAWAVAQG